MKRVLVVGSGGREHALAWKLWQSPQVGEILVAPGNAGTAQIAENLPVAATDVRALADLAEQRDVDLTVVGPEAPLALGLADLLRANGRRVVGPGHAAARLEASKSFAKDLMLRAGVPSAAYAVFDELDEALAWLADASYPLVVKADGLAAGKGVTVCSRQAEAQEAVLALMDRRLHGAAGKRVVIEEALEGPEISLLALVDEGRVVPLPVAQDHKRLGAGDTGPNTGGMGAYAPVPFVYAGMRNGLAAMVLQPVVQALADAGITYRGILYAGLMLTAHGPRVLEFNCRFGDPEAQVILPLLDGDLFPWLEATAEGRLAEAPPTFPVTGRSAVGVVLAAPGYPDTPDVGAPISGLDEIGSDVLLFHGATAPDAEGRVVTAGGRVLTVVGLGDTVDEAAARAYQAPVRFDGMQRRPDIAWQARHPSPPCPPLPQGARGRVV